MSCTRSLLKRILLPDPRGTRAPCLLRTRPTPSARMPAASARSVIPTAAVDPTSYCIDPGRLPTRPSITGTRRAWSSGTHLVAAVAGRVGGDHRQRESPAARRIAHADPRRRPHCGRVPRARRARGAVAPWNASRPAGAPAASRGEAVNVQPRPGSSDERLASSSLLTLLASAH